MIVGPYVMIVSPDAFVFAMIVGREVLLFASPRRTVCKPLQVTGDDELGRHTRFRYDLRERGERYVLGVPCTTTMRDLEAPLPAYSGRGRRPKAPWQSVTQWRTLLPGDAWTHLTVRDGEKGPVEIEMVKRRVQTRLERKRTG